jgi:hypothetical protein
MAVAANLVFSHTGGGRAFVRCTGANATINVAANSTVNSDLSFANDQVLGATITKLIWSTQTNITVSRGTANTIARLNGSGNWDFKMMGVALTEFNTQPIVITFGDANSTLFFECSKLYAKGTL